MFLHVLSIQSQTRTRTQDLRENGPLKIGPVQNTGPQGLKFVLCHMKDNVKVIHFHIEGRGVEGVVFVQITFEKYTTNFYFQSSQVGIKTKIANL